jgi:type II secretory ATPase GspE/PulE/Tfp pilus assembly ATPase PilB-like protein
MSNFADEEKQNIRLEDLRKKEEEDVIRILATRYNLNYIDLGPININTDALRLMPEELAREGKLAVFNKIDKKLQIAVFSPKNEKAVNIINKLIAEGFKPQISMTTTASLEKAWQKYKDLSFAINSTAGTFDISTEQVTDFMNKIKTITDVGDIIKDILSLKKAYKISKMMEAMIAGALALSVSDIHIEPEEEYVRIRFRLDGVLTDVFQFDTETYELLLSRIKLLSGMKLNIKNTSQDGRFSVKITDNDIEIRSSILPGAYNESIVMRLLNPKSISVPIEELGIQERTLSTLMEQISRPNGMLLITGPTGSGKTTTLYAFMKKIHSPDIKIITIEDPIEYHLPGIVQTQVEEEKEYTFLSGLRAALRQDPDVIMVGEIRDSETASIAINSALTGHLVFSTLHTNTAAGAFPRLIDLGVNPKIISSAVNVAMAQRLIRKLCVHCKKEIVPTEKEKAFIDRTVESITDKSYLLGIQTDKIWEPVGCEACHNTGYKGRIAITEIILMKKEVEETIINNPSDRDIRAAAASQNLLDMKQDGVIRILAGVTSMAELGRVIDIETEN